MNFINKIKFNLKCIGVKKNELMDYYLKTIVSNKTGFDIKKIYILVANKSYTNNINEFDEFEFYYKKKKYLLKQQELIQTK